MKNILSLSLGIVLSALIAQSGAAQSNNSTELNWLVNINQAQALSQATQKPIFAFFTGSDWCGWCKRLQATVFHKPGFAQWANDNVVLLELDFPRRKQLPPEQASQNQQLKNFFRPAGFPTIWIFTMQVDSSGQSYQINPWGSLGYPGGEQGKEETTFITNANKILATQSKK